MDPRFKEVQILIWDFDGTLYRPIPELFQAIRAAELAVIQEKKGWNEVRARMEFEKIHPLYKSATITVAKLCAISVVEAAQLFEARFDRTQFLKPDPRLVELFAKLKPFSHYILANGIKARILAALLILGLDPAIFVEIVTSETTTANKPAAAGYEYILHKTGKVPQAHMMIGDRLQVDLAPAKKLGMHTAWVYWDSDLKNVDDSAADICVPSVYDMEKVLV